jgi:hypothetical protein
MEPKETLTSETAAEAEDFLKEIYADATTTIRHYDVQRSSFTTIFASLLAIFGTILVAAGLSTTHEPYFVSIAVASAIMVALSITSCLVVLKFDALIALQRRRASLALQHYEQARSLSNHLSQINADARSATAKLIGSRFSLGSLWLAIFLILTAAGMGVMVWALLKALH